MPRRSQKRRPRRAPRGAAGFLALALAAPGSGQAPPAAGPEPALAIEHEAPRCVAAGKYARLAGCFRPQGSLARARVYFRAGGSSDWYYVEMSGAPPCLTGILPRPKKGLDRIEYYLTAIDRAFAESRTPVRTMRVTSDGRCSEGPLAPVVDQASVVIGSATGAAPAGFVTGGGLSPLLLVGGAVLAGGAAAVVVSGGGGGEGGGSSTTTTVPTPTTTTTTTTTSTSTTTTTTPTSPTTTTTTTSTTTTTTTTTTTLAPCETPNQPPVVTNLLPATGPVGNSGFVPVMAVANDPSPGSGVKEVRFLYRYCTGGFTNCQAPVFIGSDTSAPYEAVWTFPSCGSAPDEYFLLIARAEDNCGNVGADYVNSIRLTGRSCFRADAPPGRTVSWQSDLALPGARGQVVVDGTQAVFPGPGRETFAAPVGPGSHRVEGTLVAGPGRPGTWRFDLSALGIAPGSLRVVAGEVAQVGPDQVVFRLKGRAGERIVFGFVVPEPR